MAKIKTFALSHFVVSVGDYITHRSAGYTAKIISLDSRGNGTITVPYTHENVNIWHLPESKFPYTFKTKNIPKYFKHTNPL